MEESLRNFRIWLQTLTPRIRGQAMVVPDFLLVETSISNYNPVTSITGISISSCVVLGAQSNCNLSCIQIEFNVHVAGYHRGAQIRCWKLVHENILVQYLAMRFATLKDASNDFTQNYPLLFSAKSRESLIVITIMCYSTPYNFSCGQCK
jgi:hypothetical protein